MAITATQGRPATLPCAVHYLGTKEVYLFVSPISLPLCLSFSLYLSFSLLLFLSLYLYYSIFFSFSLPACPLSVSPSKLPCAVQYLGTKEVYFILSLYLAQKLCFWRGIIFIGVYVSVCLSVCLSVDYLKKF